MFFLTVDWFSTYYVTRLRYLKKIVSNFSSNQKKNQHQSWLAHASFPALWPGCQLHVLTRILIGSLYCLCPCDWISWELGFWFSDTQLKAAPRKRCRFCLLLLPGLFCSSVVQRTPGKREVSSGFAKKNNQLSGKSWCLFVSIHMIVFKNFVVFKVKKMRWALLAGTSREKPPFCSRGRCHLIVDPKHW